MTLIKICGVTRAEDVEACLALGVDAIGLNLWPGSPRCVSLDRARELSRLVGDRARVVLVFVDATPDDVAAARHATGARWAQLHGIEPPATVRALLPAAMKAVPLGDLRDADAAIAAPGIEVLVDARVAGQAGGTGVSPPLALAARVAAVRPTWLAGGLRSENVAPAIDRVRPLGVDVASGVESAPGLKDAARLRAFVEAVRGGRR